MLRQITLFLLFFILLTASAFSKPLLDSDGRVIKVDTPFTRIISLYAAHTRNLLDMGAGGQIIATGRSDKQLPDLPRLRFGDDLERLLALKPDLVLIRPMLSHAHPETLERLTKRGVAVVSLQPNSVKEMFRYWEALGTLSGHEAEAKAMIARFGAGLADIARQVEQVPESKRKKVYFESIHRRMKTFAATSMAVFVLQSAGGINIADDAVQVRSTNIAEYGKERILAKADQIDVFLAQKGRMNPVTKEMIMEEPGFQVIKAVRQGQVFLVDEKKVSRPTMDLLKGIKEIFAILYSAPQA
jgi:iron complex transport system substrate-binding protein